MPHRDLLESISNRLAASTRREIPLQGLKPAAVTVPLVPTDEGLCALFTVRSANVEHHKGQISFPGGKVELTDPDTLGAALRETWEEVGIRSEDLRVLGALDDFVSVSGFRVTPHVVYLERSGYAFEPHPWEVDRILLIPTEHLLDRNNYCAVDSSSERSPVHQFAWGSYTVWGLTATILKRLLDLGFGFSGPV